MVRIRKYAGGEDVKFRSLCRRINSKVMYCKPRNLRRVEPELKADHIRKVDKLAQLQLSASLNTCKFQTGDEKARGRGRIDEVRDSTHDPGRVDRLSDKPLEADQNQLEAAAVLTSGVD